MLTILAFPCSLLLTGIVWEVSHDWLCLCLWFEFIYSNPQVILSQKGVHLKYFRILWFLDKFVGQLPHSRYFPGVQTVPRPSPILTSYPYQFSLILDGGNPLNEFEEPVYKR